MLKRFQSAAMPVHPRVGGEYGNTKGRSFDQTGSSPRGRGILQGQCGGYCYQRFIPAWAGNTNSVHQGVLTPSVHPRVGGEYCAARKVAACNAGSSPRGRGIPHPRISLHSSSRFIPAWAGNTHVLSAPEASGPVHPRVGGEYVLTSSGVSKNRGSSPRGRGIPARPGL